MSKPAIAWVWRWPTLSVELLVTDEAAAILRSGRQPIGANERGGQLFVSTSDHRGLILASVSLPHPDDDASECTLKLNEQRCSDEIAQANANGMRFIGFWHSHPEDVPGLSPRDLSSFQSFGRKNATSVPWPVAVIVGRSETPEGIKAWSIRESACLEATSIQNGRGAYVGRLFG